MAETDKVTRILILYSTLTEGRKIHKQSFCNDMGINRRTFDRDIEDIRLFLSETYTGEEVIYDRHEESYYLKNRYQKKELSGMEITCIFESIRESKGLRKDEYKGVISNIADTCEKKQSLLLKKIAERYIDTYQNDEVTDAVMKMQWDLQQCIIEKDMIMLNMVTGDKKVVSPVALHLYEGQYYLFAYDKRKKLLVIPITEIECFQMQYSKYKDELIEKFDSIDFTEIKDLMRREKI
ncbi:hypothetical protein [Faecalicatena contorta]|uniref:hypothetical protein n=1 Tax=Faecalicatena contorta TaxID=39482 RepID=UPI001F2A8DFA|nr:hypothetical protein [Faecalicatena contorta]MCF2554375.1 hypothetical protein [Faecalicatena contorta]